MEDTEKVQLLNPFFASVFTCKAGPQASQSLDIREKAWRKEELPLFEDSHVRNHLSKLNTHKCLPPDGMHPRVLKELADIIAKPLSIICERSLRTGEMPEDRRKANITPVLKKGKKDDLVNYRPLSLTSVPRKAMEQLTLEVISKQVEEKKFIRSRQHGFRRGNHA